MNGQLQKVRMPRDHCMSRRRTIDLNTYIQWLCAAALRSLRSEYPNRFAITFDSWMFCLTSECLRLVDNAILLAVESRETGNI